MTLSRKATEHFDSPQEEVLLTLMRTSDCLHRALQIRLRPYGVTLPQYNVLRILRGVGGHGSGDAGSGKTRQRGLSASALGQAMITPVPDMTRLLGRLESAGWLVRQRDAADRRVVETMITQAGLALLDELDAMVKAAPRELLARLSCAEVGTLNQLLKKAQCCAGPRADISGADIAAASVTASVTDAASGPPPLTAMAPGPALRSRRPLHSE